MRSSSGRILIEIPTDVLPRFVILPPFRNRKCIILLDDIIRFGLDEAELKTLDELGEMMNVSRERVRQVQIRALQKLKKPRLLESLQSFL